MYKSTPTKEANWVDNRRWRSWTCINDCWLWEHLKRNFYAGVPLTCVPRLSDIATRKV